MRSISLASAFRLSEIMQNIASFGEEELRYLEDRKVDPDLWSREGLVRQINSKPVSFNSVTIQYLDFKWPTPEVKSLVVLLVENAHNEVLYWHKNGRIYSLIGFGQKNDDNALTALAEPPTYLKEDEGPEVVLHRGIHDGRLWVRGVENFFGDHNSGQRRFVHLSGPLPGKFHH